MSWLIIVVGIGLVLLIQLAAKSDTRVGRLLRASDHQAWQYAVEDKERELAELRAAEPKKES